MCGPNVSSGTVRSSVSSCSHRDMGSIGSEARLEGAVLRLIANSSKSGTIVMESHRRLSRLDRRIGLAWLCIR